MNLANDEVQKKQISTCGITDFEIYDDLVATLSIDQRVLFFKDFELVKSQITQILRMKSGAAFPPNEHVDGAGHGPPP